MIQHGIDNVGNLFPHDKPVKKGGPVAEPTASARRMFAKMGLAMPDGSFYIRNGSIGASDLDNAIKAVGRGEADGGNGNDIRRHIMKRASALKLSDRIPDTWNSDGSLKHDWIADVEEYISHFGVRGMKWGQRKEGPGSVHPSSPDAARAHSTLAVIQKHGVKAVSSADLQHLVSRQGLEQQYGRLNEAHVNAGKKAVQDFAVQFGKQQASALASKAVSEGLKRLSEASNKG